MSDQTATISRGSGAAVTRISPSHSTSAAAQEEKKDNAGQQQFCSSLASAGPATELGSSR